MGISREDVDRLCRLAGADEGFFILAMHSLIERTLREKYPELKKIEDGKQIFPFNYALRKFIDSLWEEHKRNYNTSTNKVLTVQMNNTLKNLNGLYTAHFLTHGVRHEYEHVEKSVVPSHVQLFYDFAKVLGWTQQMNLGFGRIEQLREKWQDKSYDADLIENYRNKFDDYLSKISDWKNKVIALESENAELQDKNQTQKDIINKSKEKIASLSMAKGEAERISKAMEYLQRLLLYTRTRHDYEQTIITPSSEQQDILDKVNLDTDYLVRGSAGTGKSLVLLKTLEKAINDKKIQSDNFRLLAYTKTLSKYNGYITSLLDVNIQQKTISTVDSMLKTLLDRVFPNHSIRYQLKDFPESFFIGKNFSREEIFNEADKFIWINLVSKEDYLYEHIPRTGMKIPRQNSWRSLMWEDFENTEKQIETSQIWPKNFAVKKLCEFIDQNPEAAEARGLFTDFCFVDEVQDLPPAIISLIKKTTRKSVFMAGDADQSIYLKGLKSSEVNISRGTSFRLKKNFRNSVQIHDMAEKFRNKIPGRDMEAYPTADNPGLNVNFNEKENLGDAYSEILNDLKIHRSLNTAPENICILCPFKKQLEVLAKKINEELRMKTVFVDENIDFATSEGIKLSTIHSSKGLEFPVVILLLPTGNVLYGENGLDENAINEQEHNLLYVAITRTMEILNIYLVKSNKQSPAIQALKECF